MRLEKTTGARTVHEISITAILGPACSSKNLATLLAESILSHLWFGRLSNGDVRVVC